MDNVLFMPPNILLVDDINANLVVLSETIRNAGYIPRPVNNVQQAIYAIEALPPNLILLDISMPDIDGLTFCSMLKKNVETREIPVIFITALNSNENKVKAFQLGAVDYISKPFDIEEVTMRIKTHLKIYYMHQELEANNRRLNKIINDQIHKIYEEQKNVVRSLIKLRMRMDKATSIHLEHVGKNASTLTISLQLSHKFRNKVSNSFVDTIELAAPLHDIGMAQLSKINPLNTQEPDEKEIENMKQHTIIGANILEDIYALNNQNEFIKMAIDIAKYHHENWDGSGYPIGLSGENIPLSARIVSIVNAYDFVVTERMNKPAYTHEQCMDIINKGAGNLFDPDIVTIFNKIQYQLEK